MSANNNINNLDQHQSNFATSSPNVCGGGRSTHQPRSTIEPPQQQQQTRSTFSANNNNNGSNNNIGSSNLSKIRNQQSLIDLIVAMVAIPTLVLLALTLEAKMREDWMEKEETRWAVLGIGLGLLCASLFTCGYVTHRMGVCLWAGPQEDDTYPANLTRLNTEVDIEQIIASLPPSYDTVMGCFEAPPPYSKCVDIDGEIKEIKSNKEPIEIIASSQTFNERGIIMI